MNLLGNLLIAAGGLIHLVILLVQLLIVIQVVISWVGGSLPLNTYTRLMYVVTDFIYRPIRTVFPAFYGALDFTPMLALLALYLVDNILVDAIIRTGYQLAR